MDRTVTSLHEERLGDDLVLLTLDRPEKRNALTIEAIVALTEAFGAANADRGVRGVILAGAGPSFCAGVDLHEFAEGTPESGERLIRALAALCRTVRLLD